MSVIEQIEAIEAKKQQSPWYPACGGLETPFLSRSGKTLLYMYQPSTGNHAYLDVRADIFLTNEEAQYALGNY